MLEIMMVCQFIIPTSSVCVCTWLHLLQTWVNDYLTSLSLASEEHGCSFVAVLLLHNEWCCYYSCWDSMPHCDTPCVLWRHKTCTSCAFRHFVPATLILYSVFSSGPCLRSYWAWILVSTLNWNLYLHSRLLDRGKMFVFSQQHLRRLLPFSLPSPNVTVVLDIGSGDGHVTDKLRGVLENTIHVTETSSVMQRVLKRRGYQ